MRMRQRYRTRVGIVISLCGIAIAVGAVLGWVRARGARPAAGINHAALSGLLHWSQAYTNSFVRSFAFAVLIAGVLVVIGGAFGSRAAAGLFSLVALAAAILWLVLEATKYSSVEFPFSDLRIGALLTIGASLLALISSAFLRRRRI
jgi:hypothetical protein